MSCTRRDVLKATLGASALSSLAPAVPNFLLRSVMARPRRDDRDTVLVVVQLTGGNDGLNTVVPYGDDEYARNRSTLRLRFHAVVQRGTPEYRPGRGVRKFRPLSRGRDADMAHGRS
jgi:uncharacterized protein (DUF1501 family)